MKKITLFFAALLLSLSLWAQGKKDPKTLLAYERYSSVKTALANASSEEDKYLLGLAEIGLGNLDAAKQIFSSLGDSEYGKAGLARVAYLTGDYNTGNALLNEIIDNTKRKQYYKYKLAADAITYTKGGDIHKAIEWYKKAMEKDKDAETLVALGDAYLQLNTSVGNGDALTSYQEAVTLAPSNSLAHSRQGLLLYSGRQYDAALEHYNEASKADPENPLPYRDLANAYYFVNKYDLAKQNIEKYLQLSDATEEDMYHYANLLYLTKDYPGAIIKIDEVMNKVSNPKPYLYRIKAYSLFETGKVSEAKTALDRYFSAEKDTKKYIYQDYLYQGKIAAALAGTDSANRSKYLAEANQSFEKAISLRDTTADVREQYEEIAKAFEDAKDYAGAGVWYGKLVAALGTNVASYDYFNYGYWTYFGQDFEKAKNVFTEMDTKFPGNDDKFFSLYWKGLAMSQIDKEAQTGDAIPVFESWLALPEPEGKQRSNDQLKTIYQYMTYYYYNKDDKTNGIKYATKLQEVVPDSEFAAQILEYFGSK